MESKLRHNITKLIEEAYEAADPSTGGLLGRSDLEDLVVRLATVAEQLLLARDELEQERDLLASQLGLTEIEHPISISQAVIAWHA